MAREEAEIPPKLFYEQVRLELVRACLATVGSIVEPTYVFESGDREVEVAFTHPPDPEYAIPLLYEATRRLRKLWKGKIHVTLTLEEGKYFLKAKLEP